MQEFTSFCLSKQPLFYINIFHFILYIEKVLSIVVIDKTKQNNKIIKLIHEF